jgi:hypothetical protein
LYRLFRKIKWMRVAAVLLTTVMVLLARGAPARASDSSAALRAQAADAIYSLDRDRALDLYRQATVADPNDAAAYRGLATALWLSITFRRGNMTVDDYLGHPEKPDMKGVPPAPPDIVAAYKEAVGRAAALAQARIAANGGDAEAHYQLAAAGGLRASYAATVDGSMLGAFRAARDAYAEDERVLELDPRRKDAGLIVGTYRYIVATLALPVRWVAYVAGFGGDKARGLKMVEDAASYPGDNQIDARLALVLMCNREKRYDEALAQLAWLRERFPRNRLFWLESGATSLRAGRAADAERFLDEGMRRFAGDTRPRMFGEDALWHYKRGAERAALGRADDARHDLHASLAADGRGWVHGRAELEIGRLALKAGDRAAARRHLQSAATLCDGDNDPEQADAARRLLKQAR